MFQPGMVVIRGFVFGLLLLIPNSKVHLLYAEQQVDQLICWVHSSNFGTVHKLPIDSKERLYRTRMLKVVVHCCDRAATSATIKVFVGARALQLSNMMGRNLTPISVVNVKSLWMDFYSEEKDILTCLSDLSARAVVVATCKLAVAISQSGGRAHYEDLISKACLICL